tara:strand:+ start:123 stop:269 length:147 start_codon:yes stop_codon:yes gene_type:complete
MKTLFERDLTFYSSKKKREDAIIDVISLVEDKELINDIESVVTIKLNT